MDKPWWKSSTIWGAIAAGVGALSHPEIMGLLPKPVAAALVVAGAVVSQIGMRKSVGSP